MSPHCFASNCRWWRIQKKGGHCFTKPSRFNFLVWRPKQRRRTGANSSLHTMSRGKRLWEVNAEEIEWNNPSQVLTSSWILTIQQMIDACRFYVHSHLQQCMCSQQIWRAVAHIVYPCACVYSRHLHDSAQISIHNLLFHSLNVLRMFFFLVHANWAK